MQVRAAMSRGISHRSEVPRFHLDLLGYYSENYAYKQTNGAAAPVRIQKVAGATAHSQVSIAGGKYKSASTKIQRHAHLRVLVFSI